MERVGISRGSLVMGQWPMVIGQWSLAIRCMVRAIIAQKYIVHSTPYILVVIFFSSCSKKMDTAFEGTITISSDESLQPMLNQVYQAYEHTFPETHFRVLYKPQTEAIDLMLKDTAHVVFTTREFTQPEYKTLTDKGIRYNAQHIATDGVALIVSRRNADSLITVKELEGIFTGKITDWSQLKRTGRAGKIVLIFDNANASNLDYFVRKFNLKNVQHLNISATGSNEKVIEYVKTNVNALGFIGVSWISDGEAPLTASLSKGLQVLGVSEKENPTRADYYQPFQMNLRQKTYPLRRKVYAFSREMYSGLGNGLVNYIMRDVGGLVIEKCGLWPTKPFNREIILSKEQL
jgi:phosphate transport system substrate-binding protein